jgi:hypothetical protein
MKVAMDYILHLFKPVMSHAHDNYVEVFALLRCYSALIHSYATFIAKLNVLLTS